MIKQIDGETIYSHNFKFHIWLPSWYKLLHMFGTWYTIINSTWSSEQGNYKWAKCLNKCFNHFTLTADIICKTKEFSKKKNELVGDLHSQINEWRKSTIYLGEILTLITDLNEHCTLCSDNSTFNFRFQLRQSIFLLLDSKHQ